MPLSTPQLQALSSAVAASGQANQSLVSVIGAIPVEQPPAPPPPPPPPPGPGTTLHFSAEGSNSNPGTEASPKRDLSGTNHNTLPAGSSLLFRRGDTWPDIFKILENPNVSASAPLTFDAYGVGAPPVLSVASGNMFHLGGNWNNQSDDGGYVFRNLKLDGMGTAAWGFWFVHKVRDVVVENCDITGFAIGLNSNDSESHGVTGITIRNNNIHHNRSMGMLGHYNDLLLEGNLIEANNFSGSGFDHGTYIGGGNDITVRGNRYLRNSAVNGVGQGGNCTFHGQIDGLVIEDNIIEQDSSTGGCWLLSVTTGYISAEWFLNAVIRRNTLINGGNTAMVIMSAPGVVVEENNIINRQGTVQTAISVGSNDLPEGGDVPDRDAVVRNNRIVRANGSSGAVVVFANAPGSVEHDNLVILE